MLSVWGAQLGGAEAHVAGAEIRIAGELEHAAVHGRRAGVGVGGREPQAACTRFGEGSGTGQLAGNLRVSTLRVHRQAAAFDDDIARGKPVDQERVLHRGSAEELQLHPGKLRGRVPRACDEVDGRDGGVGHPERSRDKFAGRQLDGPRGHTRSGDGRERSVRLVADGQRLAGFPKPVAERDRSAGSRVEPDLRPHRAHLPPISHGEVSLAFDTDHQGVGHGPRAASGDAHRAGAPGILADVAALAHDRAAVADVERAVSGHADKNGPRVGPCTVEDVDHSRRTKLIAHVADVGVQDAAALEGERARAAGADVDVLGKRDGPAGHRRRPGRTGIPRDEKRGGMNLRVAPGEGAVAVQADEQVAGVGERAAVDGQRAGGVREHADGEAVGRNRGAIGEREGSGAGVADEDGLLESHAAAVHRQDTGGSRVCHAEDQLKRGDVRVGGMDLAFTLVAHPEAAGLALLGDGPSAPVEIHHALRADGHAHPAGCAFQRRAVDHGDDGVPLVTRVETIGRQRTSVHRDHAGRGRGEPRIEIRGPRHGLRADDERSRSHEADINRIGIEVGELPGTSSSVLDPSSVTLLTGVLGNLSGATVVDHDVLPALRHIPPTQFVPTS